MIAQTLKWIGDIGGYLELVDQRRLPGRLKKIKCKTTKQLYEAIKTLAVRGAPAIGVAAGYGLCLAMREVKSSTSPAGAVAHLEKSADYLATARPTAVNLFWALDRIIKHAQHFVSQNPTATIQQLRQAILAEAHAVCREDIDMCSRIGKNGERFIKDGFGVLTHCNAGALATAGQGTALSVMFEAHKKGKEFTVYVDETRPLLQGARLTTWELKQAGIDVTLICDNMAAALMKEGKINAVITGADRIAANGDAANKIGTYGLSILARHHNIPFYIAAPTSTFDLTIKTGADIPIEQRPPDEVILLNRMCIAPDGIGVYNPAFDVTDAAYITAIITERGVIEKPQTESIAERMAKHPAE